MKMVDDKRRRRLSARLGLLALAALGLLLIGGCGGEDTGSPKGTVEAFIDAIVDRDGEKACSYLADEYRQQFDQAVGCAEAFTPDEGSDDLKTIEEAEIGDVSEDGDTATVEVTQDGETSKIELKKDGDDWKITNLNG